MISALEAIKRLQEGNRRFMSKSQSGAAADGQKHRPDLAAGQAPFAVVLGCSDSRAPTEIIFDQGFGDLFVIRVAGNIVAPSQLGSIELASERFGARLVVVLGHSLCGAVQATLEEMKRPSENRSPNLHSIVDRIRPSVETLLSPDLTLSSEELVRRTVRANVRASVNQLQHESDILKKRIQEDGLLIVGAEYSLETGVVDFFDAPPATR